MFNFSRLCATIADSAAYTAGIATRVPFAQQTKPAHFIKSAQSLVLAAANNNEDKQKRYDSVCMDFARNRNDMSGETIAPLVLDITASAKQTSLGLIKQNGVSATKQKPAHAFADNKSASAPVLKLVYKAPETEQRISVAVDERQENEQFWRSYSDYRNAS